MDLKLIRCDASLEMYSVLRRNETPDEPLVFIGAVFPSDDAGRRRDLSLG